MNNANLNVLLQGIMMEKLPRISIVTPSYNQGQFIAETIKSVKNQNYPNLEHIVIDGASTDETLEVLKQYQHIKIVSEPDNGHADAINKGFRIATGEIFGFLNSDDTLLPGTLHRIAREIDPPKEHHIIMGRCRFVDESGRFFGVEHPSHFESHRRLLEIWKGHLIPQPSVFWTRQVWEECGGMDEESKSPWIDYDLFCRFSKKYFFYKIDHIAATYRLHEKSKSVGSSDSHRLEESIVISKRYWGPIWHLQYWRLKFSLGIFRFDRVGRARRLLSNAKESWRHKKKAQTVINLILGGVLAPEIVFYVVFYPIIRGRTNKLVRKVLSFLERKKALDPRSAAYLEHVEQWEDKWVGPRLKIFCEAPESAKSIIIEGSTNQTYFNEDFSLIVLLDNKEIFRQKLEPDGHFLFEVPLTENIRPGKHEVEIRASSYYIPHKYFKNGDFRTLSWQMQQLAFIAGKNH